MKWMAREWNAVTSRRIQERLHQEVVIRVNLRELGDV